ncbi:hypothetical protein VVATL9824_00562 [Vibrio vulnificus]|nr:hypothetical protein VVATL9824_00562 [Vibrio vulnificus]
MDGRLLQSTTIVGFCSVNNITLPNVTAICTLRSVCRRYVFNKTALLIRFVNTEFKAHQVKTTVVHHEFPALIDKIDHIAIRCVIAALVRQKWELKIIFVAKTVLKTSVIDPTFAIAFKHAFAAFSHRFDRFQTLDGFLSDLYQRQLRLRPHSSASQ